MWTRNNFRCALKQARAASTDGLRPSFVTINAVVYAVQVKFLAHCFTLSPGKWEGLKLDSIYEEANSVSWYASS